MPAYLGIADSSDEYEFNAFYANGCTASSLLIADKEARPGYCKYVFTKYLNWVKQVANPGDIFLVANSFTNYRPALEVIRLNSETNVRIGGDEVLNAYSLELRGLGKELSGLGVRLYVTSPIPILKADPDFCRFWFTNYNNNCKILIDESSSERAKSTFDMLRDNGYQATTDYTLIDIYSVIHAKLVSSPDPLIYYFNKGHLSRMGAQLLEDKLNSSFSIRK